MFEENPSPTASYPKKKNKKHVAHVRRRRRPRRQNQNPSRRIALIEKDQVPVQGGKRKKGANGEK